MTCSSISLWKSGLRDDGGPDGFKGRWLVVEGVCLLLRLPKKTGAPIGNLKLLDWSFLEKDRSSGLLGFLGQQM